MKNILIIFLLGASHFALAADPTSLRIDAKWVDEMMISGPPEKLSTYMRSKYYLKSGMVCAPDIEKMLRSQRGQQDIRFNDADVVKMCSFIAQRWMLVAKGKLLMSQIIDYDYEEYSEVANWLHSENKNETLSIGLVK